MPSFFFTESDIDVRISSITASLLVFAVLTFVIGCLLGFLLAKHIMKSPKQDKVVSVPMPGSVPLYEEISRPPSSSALTNQGVMKIEDNEAYGCI
jgi:phosphate/sulfate permease